MGLSKIIVFVAFLVLTSTFPAQNVKFDMSKYTEQPGLKAEVDDILIQMGENGCDLLPGMWP
jgi:hypothetical protein